MRFNDQMILAMLHSHDLSHLHHELKKQGVTESEATVVVEELSRAAECDVSELASWYSRVSDRSSPLALAGLLRHVASAAHLNRQYAQAFLSQLQDIETDPCGDSLLNLLKGHYWNRVGEPQRAVEAFASTLASEVDSRWRAVSEYLRTWARMHSADSYQWMGNFRRAFHLLEGGIDCAERLQLAWQFRQRQASLRWASGAYRDALALHCDEEDRAGARARGDWNFLIRSHLSAAKCAIDMRVSAKAIHELNAAQKVLEQTDSPASTLRPYLILYSAELDTLWGNVREGIHLFEYAIELFSELDPPYYPGILDAKISLIQFALREGKYGVVFKRIAELLQEAEDRGCIEARTRLLAYQANLLLDDSLSMEQLREGYEDLIGRVHLMNNPRLTFIAYANLYAYAREHLTRYEQSFWLERLRGLETLLESSCFDDLYRDYVLERYRHEIEGPLEEIENKLDDLDRR